MYYIGPLILRGFPKSNQNQDFYCAVNKSWQTSQRTHFSQQPTHEINNCQWFIQEIGIVMFQKTRNSIPPRKLHKVKKGNECNWSPNVALISVLPMRYLVSWLQDPPVSCSPAPRSPHTVTGYCFAFAGGSSWFSVK